jgi:hypothetical protein
VRNGLPSKTCIHRAFRIYYSSHVLTSWSAYTIRRTCEHHRQVPNFLTLATRVQDPKRIVIAYACHGLFCSSTSSYDTRVIQQTEARLDTARDSEPILRSPVKTLTQRSQFRFIANDLINKSNHSQNEATAATEQGKKNASLQCPYHRTL